MSDYNNIRREDFETYTRKFVVEEPDPENPGKTRDTVKTEEVTYLNIRQQKTGAKVAMAVGLTEKVEILTTVGGTTRRRQFKVQKKQFKVQILHFINFQRAIIALWKRLLSSK